MKVFPDWSGRCVHVLGGGPSVAGFDVSLVSGDIVIACNNAGLDIMPEADCILVMDARWLQWNADRLGENRSPLKVYTQKPPRFEPPQGWTFIARNDTDPLSHSLESLSGACSGAKAINLAYLLGASEIILHGFEMKPVGNYHDDHKVETHAHLFESKFIPSILDMVSAIDGRCRVVNATPDSALKLRETV